jgi:cysteine desulfurase family protein (TIGR01976 family)
MSLSESEFPVTRLRSLFPALSSDDDIVLFDNAAGAQVPRQVLDAVNCHLIECNVQRGGRYSKSIRVDASIAQARESVAMFVNARNSDEIAFGMNATSFLRLVSLAMGESLSERNEIVVTDLDHEANIAVWLKLERLGARIRWWPMRDDGRLHVSDLEPVLSPKTRLVACTMASNALGSVLEVCDVAERVHAAGAELLLDAVHFGPHGLFDVQRWKCDYLVCSGYKIFAPHMGFLWGKSEALERLPTFREDFIPNRAPGKIEAGTFIYENVSGMDAAIRYLESIAGDDRQPSRRALLESAMHMIVEYEAGLSHAMLEGLAAIPGVTIYGIRDVALIRHRVPTVSFNVGSVPAAQVCEHLATAGIAVRDGHMYAPRLMRRLGLTEAGVVRASLVHYNTHREIQQFLHAVEQIAF